MVGVAGFELATPCTPCKCATKLRYTPNRTAILANFLNIASSFYQNYWFHHFFTKVHSFHHFSTLLAHPFHIAIL